MRCRLWQTDIKCQEPIQENEETGNFRNEIHSGVIDTLNGHIIHVLFEMASNYYHVLCNHLACWVCEI